MRYLFAILFIILSISSGRAATRSAVPEPILPATLQWRSPPDMPGVQGAWVLGSEQKPGLYIMRVRLAAGAKIAPHTHPDVRHTTVLAGTIHVGVGESFDETKVVAVPPGGVYVAPANVPHYVWCKQGGAVYQESGEGPTRTSFIDK